MTFKIQIQEVNVEEVRNGRNKYDKAEVNYLFQGQPRTQKIMSFANPAIFKQVKEAKPGSEWEITVTKDDKGYNSWSKMVAVGADAPPAPAGAPAGVRTNVSTYETAEERRVKQLYIIRQSSISNALQYLTATRANDQVYTLDDVLENAQVFVDFVYGNKDDLFQQENDLGDVPV